MPQEVETVAEGQEIDVSALIAQKNAAEQARREGKEPEPIRPPLKEAPKAEAKTEEAPKSDEKPADNGNRNLRRQLRRLTLELGEMRGKLSAYEQLGIVAKGNPADNRGSSGNGHHESDGDPEPQRQDFADDAQYHRALGRWDARQEAKREVGKATEAVRGERELEALKTHISEMDKKAEVDIKLIPDWDDVQKAAVEAAEAGDAPTFKPDEHPYLMRRIATSDVKAFMLHHLAKEPKDLEKLLNLSDNIDSQAQFFSRLEGKVEKMYSKQEDSGGSGRQAPEKEPENKGRTHPAEAQAGRNAAERDARKPRPTTEVAARGGSAVPEEPLPGTAAWMAKRNAITGGR